MKKISILIGLLLSFLAQPLIAQNTFPSYEGERLTELMNLGIVRPSSASIRVNNVTKFYKDNPNLMDLPVKDGRLQFDSLIKVPGVDKDRLFRRVKEFTAMYYGNINSVLHYEDPVSGVIILKGRQGLAKNDYISNWNAMFSGEAMMIKYLTHINFIVKIRVDDGLVKIELRDVELIGQNESAIATGIPISSIFPFVNMKSLEGIKSAAETVEGIVATTNSHLGSFSFYMINTLNDDNWRE